MRYFLALSLSCALSWAQDYVVMKVDGRKVECAILEENEDGLKVRIEGKRYTVPKSALREWKRAPRPEAHAGHVHEEAGPDKLYWKDGTADSCEILSTEGDKLKVRAEGKIVEIPKSEVERWEQADRSALPAGLKGKINSLVKKLAQQRTDSNPIDYRGLTEQLSSLLKRKGAADYAVVLLRRGPVEARGRVALALARARVRKAGRDVFALVRSYAPADVPTPLIEAVGRFGGDEGAKVLIELFPGLTAFKKQAAIGALGHTGSKWATRFLMTVMDGDDPRARGAAKVALIQLGKKDETVARAIADKAGESENPAEWIRTLTYLGDRSNLAIIRGALRSSDAEAQRAAAEALGYYKDRRSVGGLLELLKDRERPSPLRVQCAISLRSIGDDRVIDELIALLGKPGEDRRVRQAVHGALKALTGEDLPANVSVWAGARTRDPYRARVSPASATGGPSVPDRVVLPLESRPAGPPPENLKVGIGEFWKELTVLGALAAGAFVVYLRRRAVRRSVAASRKKVR